MISDAVNSEDFACKKCNSDEETCISGQSVSATCDPGVTTCYVKITGGMVDRGCYTSDVVATCSLEDGAACKLCTTSNCNAFEWLRCHQCLSSDEACSDAKVGEGTFCGKYKANGKCYERFEDGRVERGCEVDKISGTDDVCQSDEQCKSCDTGDGCNNHAGRDLQVTKCVQCDTSNDAAGSCLGGTKDAAKCGDASDGKCYSKILDGGSLKHGCLSELSSAEADACTGTQCNICEGDGCNKRVFPIDRLRCNQCDKSTDADCATDLTGDAKSSVCKKYVENDKCYSRAKDDQSFDRGCQSDLPANEQGCPDLMNCFECAGNNCNSLSEQKLKESTKCQQCNSDDAACLAGTAPAQSCGQESDVCYVRINSDGKLERGCLSSLTSDADKLKCNTETDKTCIACQATATDSACNSQKWFQCHKCSSSDDVNCANAQAGYPKFCTNYRETNKCYERFVDGTEVQRGCEGDLSPETENVCVANQQCSTCTEDGGCNNKASTAFQETKCVVCKSNDETDTDGSCLKGTKAEEVCANPDGKCFSRIIEGGILERGCRSTLTGDEQTACTGTQCQLCGTAGCNKDVFPENRAQCYRCQNTATDKTCSEELTGDAKSEICAIYKEGDKCFSKVDNDVFQRGCQSDLGDNVNTCDGLNDCLECEGSNCNGLSEETLKKWAKCLQCDTEDEACIEAKVSAATCQEEGDSCTVRINNGKLERSCLSSLSAADQEKCNSATDLSCVTCTGAGCNTQTWIKCHQCKESESATCNAAQEDASQATYCPKYKDNNKCYERLESEKVVRGCESDLSEEACSNSLECSDCNTNACNNAAASTLKTDQRCLQCSTASDAGGLCLAGTTSTLPCTKESESKCYFQIQADGHLKRGCKGELSAAEVTACTGDTCKICDVPSCNTGIYPTERLQCFQCKSTDDESCVNELQGTEKSAVCKLYKADDKCYSRDVNDDQFERGCQSDLGLDADDACKDLTDKQCRSCDETNCNAISKKVLNGAGPVALNVMLLAFVLFLGVFAVL